MSNLTDEEELTIKSYDTVPFKWADYFDNNGGWPLELEKFHKFLPKGHILEIGAGTGRDAEDLIKLGYEYVGTDISEPLLDIARKKLSDQEFINMSLYDLYFPNKFDGFWASAVLLHIPKKRIDEALQKIKSTQKKNAVGFISIKDGLGEELLTRNMDGVETKRFFALWSREEFEKVLRSNGFEILYYSYRTVTKNTKWHMFIVKVV